MTASVVCGVDHSRPSRAAARLAAALAGRLGLELVLVHALDAAEQRSAARARLRALRRELGVPDARLRVDVGPAPEQAACEPRWRGAPRAHWPSCRRSRASAARR